MATYVNEGTSGGLTRYTVYLTADTAGDTASAWDGTFSGALNQDWAYGGNLATPTLTNVNASGGGVNALVDSHFLFLDGQIFAARTPSENHGSGPGLPNPTTGTYLDGAFTVLGNGNMNLPLAQIVVAAGQTVTMSGEASNALGQRFATNLVLPEPGTLALVGLGLAGLAWRRARR